MDAAEDDDDVIELPGKIVKGKSSGMKSDDNESDETEGGASTGPALQVRIR